MARIRSIKPEFWTDEKVVGLSPLARLVFIGLWNFADDEGRADYSPMRLKMQILPADDAEMSLLLEEIRGAGLIVVYSVENKEYLEICGFAKHQKIDKRTTSKRPPPPTSAEVLRFPTTDQGRDQGREGIKDIGGAVAPAKIYRFEGRTIRIDQSQYDRWRKAYPRFKDFDAALQRADDYYTENPNPDGKWFFRVSRWLEQENAKLASNPEDAIYRGVL
jgi:hypothetical protein